MPLPLPTSERERERDYASLVVALHRISYEMRRFGVNTFEIVATDPDQWREFKSRLPPGAGTKKTSSYIEIVGVTVRRADGSKTDAKE